jgi:hypothetical protein
LGSGDDGIITELRLRTRRVFQRSALLTHIVVQHLPTDDEIRKYGLDAKISATGHENNQSLCTQPHSQTSTISSGASTFSNSFLDERLRLFTTLANELIEITRISSTHRRNTLIQLLTQTIRITLGDRSHNGIIHHRLACVHRALGRKFAHSIRVNLRILSTCQSMCGMSLASCDQYLYRTCEN